MRVSLLDFMRTGRFGDLQRGDTPAKVMACLGPPLSPEQLVEANDGKMFWGYSDSVLLYFFEGILVNVFLCWRDSPGLQLPESVEQHGPTFTPETTVEDIRAMLDREGIPYGRKVCPPPMGILELTTGVRPNRAVVVFDMDTERLIEMCFAFE